MLVDETEKINSLYAELTERMGGLLKIITYSSQDYPGYSYIKVYNKNASREHMSEYIRTEYNIPKTEVIDSRGGDSLRSINNIARELKKRYEPLITLRDNNTNF